MPRVSIGLGLGSFPFDTMAGFWRWVDLCEEGGIDSLWQSDRIVGPEPVLESLTLMAALAGRTQRLKFGMNVVSLAFREPVLLAKQCATIDMLSAGRLLPAFGIGSPIAPEWSALNVDPKTRGAKADEALEIIRRLWAGETVTFEGKHFRVKEACIVPRPVQAELPLWIGGSSDAAIRRTARFGTGWQSTIETPQEIAPLIAKIRAAAGQAGRAIDEGHYGAGIPFHLGSPDDPGVTDTMALYKRLGGGGDFRERVAVGDVRTLAERLAAYVTAGATKFILRPMVRGDTAILAQTKRLIAELLPAVASQYGCASPPG